EDGCCEGVRQATVEVEPQLAYVAACLADAPQASDEDVERQLRWTRERLLRRRLESERQGDGADTDRRLAARRALGREEAPHARRGVPLAVQGGCHRTVGRHHEHARELG